MSLFQKGFMFYAAVVLPVLCHLFTLVELPNEPTWQSGERADQLVYILSPLYGYPLFPFLGFSTTCMALILVSEPRFADHPLIKFGILTGFVVCVWYAVVFGMTATQELGQPLFFTSGILSFVLISGLVSAAGWIRRRLRWSVGFSWLVGGLVTLPLVLGGTFFIAWSGSTAASFTQNYLETLAFLPAALPLGLFVASCYFSTIWASLAYLWMGVRILVVSPSSRSFSLAGFLAIFTWLAGFISACRWSITLALAEYAKLPIEDPGDCYVATAAARGHLRCVGSEPYKSCDGQSVYVNRQLRILKAGEITLRCMMPRFHGFLRWAYNRIGPQLARRIQQPWQADFAFLLLKPIEWLTALALHCVLGQQARRWINRLYSTETQ